MATAQRIGEASTPAKEPTPLPIALLYRQKTGCRQYPFYSLDDLAKFAGRHPYRGETFRILVIADREIISTMIVPAHSAEAGALRKIIAKAEGRA